MKKLEAQIVEAIRTDIAAGVRQAVRIRALLLLLLLLLRDTDDES